MASTIKPSTFQVRIKEDHVINGIRTVNENLMRIPEVTNYDRRVVTCPNTTSVDLINTNGLTPGPALFPSYSIAYGRITNMDDSYRLAVSFTSSLGRTGILYPAKELFPQSYLSGGTKGVAGVYLNVSATGGSGVSATFDVTTSTLAGHLTPLTAIPIIVTSTATLDGNLPNIQATSTSGGGSGATFSIRSVGGNITEVIIDGEGSGYQLSDTITFSKAFLTGLVVFGTVANDVVVRLNTPNMLVRPTSVKINNQGYGYNVNDNLTVNLSNIGSPTGNLVMRLIASDFTTDPNRSYWTMECLPTSSIMFSSPNCSGSNFVGSFDQDIEFISVYAISSSIDVEYVLVNAPIATN
jgi:hypothetical protein|tara:strand:+ start:91 stop:1149 length:1059 start_codon:yes stop_codon:yes gene_type:complete